MPDSIELLPDSVANQIAAGEVIQRPASVVKELMENSLDARATSIKIIIKEAGKSLIQVIDNGIGMNETDARLSFERHATSKIRKAEDLFQLRTMGFRGEALASIAAIAQVEMKTRPVGRELGTSLLLEGTTVINQEQNATDLGTGISVKNLFFNIPVRRNFLKSNQVEIKHITEVFLCVALAHPDKSFVLIVDDRMIYELRPEKLAQRIVSLFGKSYQKQLAPCSEETSSLRVTGYVGKPEMAKKTRGDQYLFVNHRYIKSNYINHAVFSAFKGILPEETFPFYVLFVELDPKEIDINVHPTKTEIKFNDARIVYAIINATVNQALGVNNFVPTIDFASDTNIIDKLSSKSNRIQDQYYEDQFAASTKRKKTDNWNALFEGMERSENSGEVEEKIQKKMDMMSVPEVRSAKMGIFQFRARYLVTSVKKGLMIIDQQAAHERVLYERYILCLKQGSGNSQQSLFPQIVEFSSPADFALVMEIKKEIMSLGFRFEEFGKNTVLVNGVPTGVLGKEKSLFEEFVEQFKINQSELSLPVNENLAWSLAKRTSVKRGHVLLEEEINSIVEQLFACQKPGFDARGNSTFFIFENAKIDDFFHL